MRSRREKLPDIQQSFEVPEPVPYVDNAVTTKMAPGVFEAMLPYLRDEFGDPEEPYRLGCRAFEDFELLREDFADILGATPENVWFTSGGTESNNWILRRVERQGFVVCSMVEHLSVIENADVYVDVDENGIIDLTKLIEVLGSGDVKILSVQYANQDTGVVQPIQEISLIAKDFGIPFHVDATMAFGLLPLNVYDMGINFLTVSAHKVWGPVGVGALISDGKYGLNPLFKGGGQQGKMRPGAINMAGIAGFVKAITTVRSSNTKIASCRDFIEAELVFSGAIVNGKKSNRVGNMSNMTFPGLDAAFLAAFLEKTYGLCVGIGGSMEAGNDSRVLNAMKLSQRERYASLRFRLDPWFTKKDSEMIIAGLSAAVWANRGREIL